MTSKQLLLLAYLTAGTFATPIEDSNFLDRDRDSDRDRDRDKDKDKGKEASKLDNTIMEVLREVIREQNKSSKSSDKAWTEMMSRSLPWVPLMMMMGRGSSPPQCPCMTNPYATYPGAIPHFMGQYPYYGGYNPQYRFPESYPPNIPFPQNQNPLAELNGPTSLDTRQIHTIPNFSRSYNYYGQHQPYPMAATSYYPDSPFLTADEDYFVQQPGIMQAIKARLKSELAGVATKINPSVDQAQPLMTPQSPSSAHQSSTARKTLSPHQSPAAVVSSDYHQPLPSKMQERSTSSGTGQQPSRSTKPSFWKQVTSAL